MEKKINIYAGNNSVEISIPLKGSNLEGVIGVRIQKDQSVWSALSQHLSNRYCEIMDTVCKKLKDTKPSLNFKFLMWVINLGKDIHTQIPQELSGEEVLSYAQELVRIVTLQKEEDFGATCEVINTQHGCVLTVTIGDQIILEDLVEPVLDTTEEVVGSTPTQPEPPEQEDEEVVTDPPPNQHQTPNEGFFSLELVACQNDTCSNVCVELLTDAEIDMVISSNNALWRRYSINGTNALW